MAENSNSNGRVWRSVAGVLGTLLVAAVVALFRISAVVGDLKTRQELMGIDVAKNAQWIVDWSTIRKVPERDQHQDDAIEDLEGQNEEIIRRLLGILEQREGPP